MNGQDVLDETISPMVQLHERIADVIQRFQQVSQDALSLAVDVRKYAEHVEASVPASHERDRLIAETVTLQNNLISLASPRKTETTLIEVPTQ